MGKLDIVDLFKKIKWDDNRKNIYSNYNFISFNDSSIWWAVLHAKLKVRNNISERLQVTDIVLASKRILRNWRTT